MKRNIRPLVMFIAIIVLIIAIVGTANYLMPPTRNAELVFPTGSGTITDDLGDSPYPELDIVEATVEGNETNLIFLQRCCSS